MGGGTDTHLNCIDLIWRAWTSRAQHTGIIYTRYFPRRSFWLAAFFFFIKYSYRQTFKIFSSIIRRTVRFAIMSHTAVFVHVKDTAIVDKNFYDFTRIVWLQNRKTPICLNQRRTSLIRVNAVRITWSREQNRQHDSKTRERFRRISLRWKRDGDSISPPPERRTFSFPRSFQVDSVRPKMFFARSKIFYRRDRV